MLNGRAADIKRHKWFDGLDWDALEARRMEPPRLPKDDSAKRLRELTVSAPLSRPVLAASSCARPQLWEHRAKPSRPVPRAGPQQPHACTSAQCCILGKVFLATTAASYGVQSW